jgi:hypothetical protein
MFYRTKVLAASFVAVAGVFSGAAFGQSIEGTVRGYVCICPHPRIHALSFEIFLLCERSGKAASASG